MRQHFVIVNNLCGTDLEVYRYCDSYLGHNSLRKQFDRARNHMKLLYHEMVSRDDRLAPNLTEYQSLRRSDCG